MFKTTYNKETSTYYITYKGLDFYILSEKLGIYDLFISIVEKHGGEVTKSGEDFFTEEEAYDALEEVEGEFDTRFPGIIDELRKQYDMSSLIAFLVVFTEEELQKKPS